MAVAKFLRRVILISRLFRNCRRSLPDYSMHLRAYAKYRAGTVFERLHGQRQFFFATRPPWRGSQDDTSSRYRANDADSFQFLRCRHFVGKDDDREPRMGLWVADSLTPQQATKLLCMPMYVHFISSGALLRARPGVSNDTTWERVEFN